ncbi:MAG: DUF4097 family beta strand repeat protein [Candidatus Aminicenantes bacterium]|nr:DUF4097 family beta strand repeat protein [Candidatus Aminicenantes bacterium]
MRKLVLLFLIAGIGFSGNIQKEKVYTVKEPPVLELKIVSGKIIIKQWDKKQVKVSLKVRYWDEEPRIEMEKSGDRIYVEVKGKNKFCLFCSRRSPKAYLVVSTPGGYSGEIKTVSGDIYFEGTPEYIKATTVSGEISFSDVTAKKINLHSVSGDFKGNRLVARSVGLSTVSGDIYINNIVAPEVKGETVSGDVSLASEKAVFEEGEWRFTSVSGDIRIAFDSKPEISIFESRTVSGDIELDNETATGKLRKRFGDKGIRIYIKTVSGDIRISGI